MSEETHTPRQTYRRLLGYAKPYRGLIAAAFLGMLLEALEEIPAAGTRVRIAEYDIDILDVQDNMIKQVQVLPVKPLRESVSDQ